MKFGPNCVLGSSVMFLKLYSPVSLLEYYFTDPEAMQKSIDAGEFIESAVYNKNLYGTR